MQTNVIKFLSRYISFKMSGKINYPSAERNKPFILEVLKKHFDTTQSAEVLEIASGSGQHIGYFAKHFPNLTFQPSELDGNLFNSIRAYALELPERNVVEPLKIDIALNLNDSWPLPKTKYDYMININMMHISPYECTLGLFRNAAEILKPKGIMITYGPYAENGIIKPQSNVDFDESLRWRDPSWGLRDIKDLKELANQYGMELIDKVDMPANNKCLVWKLLRQTC